MDRVAVHRAVMVRVDIMVARPVAMVVHPVTTVVRRVVHQAVRQVAIMDL